MEAINQLQSWERWRTVLLCPPASAWANNGPWSPYIISQSEPPTPARPGPIQQTLTSRNPTSNEVTQSSSVSSSSLLSLKDVSPHGSVCVVFPTRGKHADQPVSKFNSDDNYPSASYRDRVRFLLFTSWWTVVFTAGYLAFFLINAGSFLVSIASHGIWLTLTYVNPHLRPL